MSGRLVLFLLAVLAAGGLATLASRDPGYVLIIWQHTSLETSLWVAIILVILAGLLLRWLIALLTLLLSGRAGWRNWRARRRYARYCADEDAGRKALLEGQWKVARKRLQAAASRTDRPVTAWLGAARAANALGELQQRDDYLARARASAPDLDLGIELERAELQLAADELKAARELLETLATTDASNVRRLQLLAEVLVAQGDVDAVQRLLPELEKRGRLAPQALQRLCRIADESSRVRAQTAAVADSEAQAEESDVQVADSNRTPARQPD